MKRGARLTLSAVSGIAAAVLALAYGASVREAAERERRESMERYGGELVAVCVATREIEPGEELGDGNVAVEEWVSSLLPPDAAMGLDDVAGTVATSRIPERSVIARAHLRERAEGIEVPRGKVAVSVASDEEHALGGALGRGDQVDVYVSREDIADRIARATVLDTSALAVDGGQTTWVTLAVDPSDVKEVLVASGAGAVTLVLPAGAHGAGKGGA